METALESPPACEAYPGKRCWGSLLPGLESESVLPDDIVLTPDDVARDVVARFNPRGRVLDPCKGEGAFLRHMDGADWCEIREGRDFFRWTDRVDWIVSNPPYSIFSEFLRHAFTVADDIVFLIPVNKAFNSDRMMREIWAWGGIETVYVVGGGGALGFPIRFCIGAVHFRRGYRGGMRVEFRTPNTVVHQHSSAQHRQPQ
jgi:hypothetical protein